MSSCPEFQVVGLGAVLVDHQVVLPSFPEPDTKLQIVEHRFQVGGPVPTALVLLSRFGRKCKFIGKWGHDAFGEMIERDLNQEGLQLDHSVRTSAGATGFAHVWVDQGTGSRTIAWSHGGFDPICPSQVDEQHLGQCKVLHLDGSSHLAALKAATFVKGNGGRVFLDTGSPKAGLDRLFPLVDVMICPERFPLTYFGLKDPAAAAQALLGSGVRTVILTRGANGATAYTAAGQFVQAAFPVSTVDTTGAGDVFCGGLIHGLLDEARSLAEAMQFAAAAAALKCRKLGNRDALPTQDEVNDLIS